MPAGSGIGIPRPVFKEQLFIRPEPVVSERDLARRPERESPAGLTIRQGFACFQDKKIAGTRATTIVGEDITKGTAAGEGGRGESAAEFWYRMRVRSVYCNSSVGGAVDRRRRHFSF
jgi:hypothetical protein